MSRCIVRKPGWLRQAGWGILALWLESFVAWAGATNAAVCQEPKPLSVSWQDNILRIKGETIPGGEIEIWYLEAYCRANSHRVDWRDTVVPHRTRLMEAKEDGSRLVLQCRVEDGLVVDHVITASADEIDFDITATNPTNKRSEVHWAQPCVRVGGFTGTGPNETDDAYAYIKKSFVFLDGELQTMPTQDWASQARYTPGQVWAAPGVPASDVNPRPLNPHRPSLGLIGCVSGDGSKIFAIAFEPYQELFQGVIRCLHSDFRLGGLAPGEVKKVRGKIYIVPNDPKALVDRYEEDFSEE
jgi:hypothetical protein